MGPSRRSTSRTRTPGSEPAPSTPGDGYVAKKTVKKDIPEEGEVVFVEPQELIEITGDEMSSAEEDKAKNKIRDKSKNQDE